MNQYAFKGYLGRYSFTLLSFLPKMLYSTCQVKPPSSNCFISSVRCPIGSKYLGTSLAILLIFGKVICGLTTLLGKHEALLYLQARHVLLTVTEVQLLCISSPSIPRYQAFLSVCRMELRQATGQNRYASLQTRSFARQDSKKRNERQGNNDLVPSPAYAPKR